MGRVEERYAALKTEYFDLLDTAKAPKGDVRVLVALRTWVREAGTAGSSGLTAADHVGALSEALEGLRTDDPHWVRHEVGQLRRVWTDNGHELPRHATVRPLVSPPVPQVHGLRANGLKVVSLFTGAMGLDLGFAAAGFDIVFATDIDTLSMETLHRNMPSVPFVLDDIRNVPSRLILDQCGVERGSVDVLTGGPPCQPFSTAGRRRGLEDPRATPLHEFVRVIEDIQPRAFVMEEVTGLLSARLRHVPIRERAGRELSPEEEKGSLFEHVMGLLRSTGYNIVYGVLNAADYGAPQVRHRVIIIGARDGTPHLPVPTHASRLEARHDSGVPKPWTTFWECTADLHGCQHEVVPMSPARGEYMRAVPPGGHWRHLPEGMVGEAMGGALHAGGGKMGFYRRLSWDEPSPTVVTSPLQKGSMMVHPEATRALSVQEYRRVQGFPDDWAIPGTVSDRYRLIGNAVPVYLSYAIARAVEAMLR